MALDETRRTDAPHILAIDDEPACLRTVVDALDGYGFVVLTARDGATGLQRARYARPDLILLDVEMPGLDGFETRRRLEAHPATADIPVIYFTGRTGGSQVRQAFDLGAVDYVTKPCEPAELVARVRTHLELQRRRRESEASAARLGEHVATVTRQLRAELDRRSSDLADREHLLAVLRLQTEQLRAATGRWLERSDPADGSGAHLRVETIERLSLVRGWMKRARLDAEGGVAANLDTALALLAPLLDDHPESGSEPALTADLLPTLSTRERQVFDLLVDGASNKEIAAGLGLAKTTVSTYRVRIFEKLGVDDIAGLVRVGVRARG